MGMNHDAATYEDIHFNDIKKHMKLGDTMYDIGVYDGITSVLVAQAVGAENVVLVEPAENNWATVKAYWEKHGFMAPKATYAGFIGAFDTTDTPAAFVHAGEFPPEANQFPVSFFEEHSRFRSIQDPEGRPQLTIDSLAQFAGVPKGITIDIEGAELLAIRGATKILSTARPIVWISIHPAFMKERFGYTKEQLIEHMDNMNYATMLLAVDHEEHFRFFPKEMMYEH